MITPNAQKLDDWIRTSFCEINTSLEELYFTLPNPAQVSGVGDEMKRQLCQEGQDLISRLVAEGNTDEGFEAGFNLLGNVGFYLAACRRHEIDAGIAGPAAQLRAASSLALQLGATLGVTPRFATSHLTTHNQALNGRYKTFTSLEDEYTFIDYNTRGILAYKRAADALLRILPLGVSHPVTADLLQVAKQALEEVVASNQNLFQKLDTRRFFYNVRPYYKPHPVGFNIYRGANAGDFAGINVIDLLLGLCQANQASYAQLLVDKFLYMMPEDQLMLRDCMRRPNLMDGFLAALPEAQASAWFQKNAALFLAVCQAHGESARQHHDQLVARYISQPAETLPPENHTDLTASGPPLPVLLAALARTRQPHRSLCRRRRHRARHLARFGARAGCRGGKSLRRQAQNPLDGSVRRRESLNNFGSWLPDETVEAFKEFLVGIKGPLTTPIGGGIRSLNVALRKALDLYVCQRPVRYFTGVPSPVKHPNMSIWSSSAKTPKIFTPGSSLKTARPTSSRNVEEHFPKEYAKIRFPDSSGLGLKPVSR
jgi:hypothetical protein